MSERVRPGRRRRPPERAEVAGFGGSASSRTTFVVEITHGLEGYLAVVRAQGERTGERRVSDFGPGCENLADALTLTLAIALDNDRNRQSIADDAPEADQPTLPVADARSAASTLPIALELGAGAGLGVGPSLQTIALFDAELWLDRIWTIGAGGWFTLPQDATLGVGSVQMSVVSAQLWPCGSVVGSKDEARLALCGLALLGVLRGEGDGFHQDGAATLFWSAFGAGLHASGPLFARVHWSLRAAGCAAPGDREFTVDRSDATYRARVLVGFAAGGLRMEM